MTRSKRAEERRSQILEHALLVFAHQGYHGASVSDIVKAAGVARGTFYLYFDSKEAVFRELLDELLSTLRSSVRGMDIGPSAAPMQEQLQGILVRILRTAESNRALTRIIFREAVGLDEAVDAKLQGFNDGLQAWLVAALTVGEGLELVRPTDRDVAATCILGAVRQVIDRYVVQSDAPLDAESIAAAVVRFSLEGLA
ncbi:MAG: TetR/AcrR family transcriptional regulator [Myxococcales bacterium]|nr:TetR/AcrR family transcriptional regulator [Myxococcales bacterium]MCB9669617.1 TetR/AcrR family transcriptional regulator [Alphaproteobacteria bacterium]